VSDELGHARGAPSTKRGERAIAFAMVDEEKRPDEESVCGNGEEWWSL
jgi:hypothetical protein